MDSTGAAHLTLTESLITRGVLPRGWRDAWERVPRDQFIPPTIWRQGSLACEPVTTDDERRQFIHSDEPVIVQVDDGEPDGPLVATSSNSMPTMVARMLALLRVEPGHRVLEIGTATGYVAALLSERLGDEDVFSVEIDPALARMASAHLAAAGYSPTVVVTDGEHGWPSAAPYDRLIATCALRHVPYTLIQQIKAGGILVAPMARDFWSGALVQLFVQEDGTAAGPFRGGASYMPMRSHRLPATTPVTGDGRAEASALDPRQLCDLGFALYAGARLPGVSMVHAEQGGSLSVWLQSNDGSGAVAESGEPVRQYGRRSLWHEIEAVHREFIALGTPEPEEFGLTITPDGQRVWLGNPEHLISPAP